MQNYENYKVITKSKEDTEKVAANFATTLNAGDIVLLSGDLGAGKTVFSKGFVRGRNIVADVVSPTFTIMNEYGNGEVYHFDLYRLNSIDEFEGIGAYEQLYSSAVSIVEWPEVVGFDYFPETAYVVEIIKLNENTREIRIRRNKI